MQPGPTASPARTSLLGVVTVASRRRTTGAGQRQRNHRKGSHVKPGEGRDGPDEAAVRRPSAQVRHRRSRGPPQGLDRGVSVVDRTVCIGARLLASERLTGQGDEQRQSRQSQGPLDAPRSAPCSSCSRLHVHRYRTLTPALESSFGKFIVLPGGLFELRVILQPPPSLRHRQDQVGGNSCAEIRVKLAEMDSRQFDKAALATRGDAGAALAPQDQLRRLIHSNAIAIPIGWHCKQVGITLLPCRLDSVSVSFP